MTPDATAARLGASLRGLEGDEAGRRLLQHGRNRIEAEPPPSLLRLLLHQFQSPLIYILLAAAAIALLLGELADAGFIGVVLGINAAIGFVHEARAERGIRGLAALVRTRVRVVRSGRQLDLDGEELVPGDLLLLESGGRVAADLRLLEVHGLRVDESLLTGESLPIEKHAAVSLPPGAPLAERTNMAFAGSMVVSGRGRGLVVATGSGTEVGAIANQVRAAGRQQPPLLLRLRRFARNIGIVTVVACAFVLGLSLLHGHPLGDSLLNAVALAVSAIPEGLPIALSVALAVAVSRMVRRRVIVRNLPAVEGLGSCSVIATDKTGTLTVNQLTVERVVAAARNYRVTGRGYAPDGELRLDDRAIALDEHPGLQRLLRAACLANEGDLVRTADGWQPVGDPTDVALVALAHKAGLDAAVVRRELPLQRALPFEPELRFCASFHPLPDGSQLACVKGAPEQVLAMCQHRLTAEGRTTPLDADAAHREFTAAMADGYRVLALADGALPPDAAGVARELRGLTYLGLVGMTDPPRPGVAAAIASCRRAGIRVLMITGDHATTAAAIAARIGLSGHSGSAVSGPELQPLDDTALARRLRDVAVVARTSPIDKLRVVRALQQDGPFVAVTGDGVNDAPALRQANLGVAMGRSGTDVAREAADLVITDDDFASIVAGVEEGRIAYDNVRKAIYLLVSTGAAEVLLVLTVVAIGLPAPLSAVQLLWLNLVTNGVQGVAMVFEPGEPGVLDRPPRSPREPVFDRLMIRRTLLAALVMAVVGCSCWLHWFEDHGVEQARGLMVNLFVLFELLHLGNARSENIPLHRLSPMANPLLLLGTLAAVGLHLFAMHWPWLGGMLGLQPMAFQDWLLLLLLALPLVAVLEADKLWRRHRARRRSS